MSTNFAQHQRLVRLGDYRALGRHAGDVARLYIAHGWHPDSGTTLGTLVLLAVVYAATAVDFAVTVKIDKRWHGWGIAVPCVLLFAATIVFGDWPWRSSRRRGHIRSAPPAG